MKDTIKELDKILPVVVRVHGDNHPELAQVGSLYTELRAAMDADNMEKAKELMAELRKVTDDFAIPSDACVTYEKTYADLQIVEKEMV